MSFARGVITWIVLHREPASEDAAACGSIREACRITCLRYPTLLVGSVLYGALITTGIVATTELTETMEFAPTKMAHIWSGSYKAFSDSLRQFTWRGFNKLIPDPGSPFAEFVPDLRDAVKQSTQVTFYESWLADTYYPEMTINAYSTMPEVHSKVAHEIWMWLIPFASMLLIFPTETPLRFRTVMAMTPPRSPRPRRLEWLTPPFASAHFGLRHFGAITVHTWLVRLAIFALSVAFIEFPSAVMDNFVAPNVLGLGVALGVGGFEVLPIMRFIASAGAALVGAIFAAFTTVYDARLYLASAHCSPLASNSAVRRRSAALGISLSSCR